ncbi:MAG: response regulator [Armatimonadetes bacterium]|nr:response regulator [Armatimonadota bacterium]
MPERPILIVEDNQLNMELTTDVLEAAGYQVQQAYSAEDGLTLARIEPPALVLMDVSLPGMDGLTATWLLKQDPRLRRIPVIALTAHAMTGDRERMLDSGCDGYLPKPIDTRTLPQSIEAFLAAARGVSQP